MTEVGTTATPRHLWIIGGVVLVWSLLGGVDFLLLVTRNAWYQGHFTPEQIEFGNNYPAWLVVAWAIAVWGSALGATCLLLRNQLAVPVLVVSFVSMMVMAIRNMKAAEGSSGFDFGVAVVFLIVLGLIAYARSMARRGVLV